MPRKTISDADVKRISDQIFRLLSHYWAGNEPEEIRRAQIGDWLDDLCEFSPAIVQEACNQWRHRSDARRPMPGDIRVSCIALERAAKDHTLAIESKTARWESWLYEIWGPASTGIPAREAAMRRRDESLVRAELWRNSEEGRAILAGLKKTTLKPEFKPAPEQMAAGRRALGLEEP